jgi:hypothetical protein
MNAGLSLRRLRKIRPLEHALRFCFGGAITAAALKLTEVYGPGVGGLFLAFPALLPATATRLGQHDSRRAAFDEARGTIAGSVGLVSFPLVVWIAAGKFADRTTLVLALGSWLVVSALAWRLFLGRRPPRQQNVPGAVSGGPTPRQGALTRLTAAVRYARPAPTRSSTWFRPGARRSNAR